MDASHFDEAVRNLVSSPTRRSLVGLVLGAFLGPLLHVTSVEGRGGGGSRKTHKHKAKKKKQRKKKASSQCPPRYEFCQAGQGQSSAGEYSECCKTAIEPVSGDPYEVCTDCGCCPLGNTQCCPSAGDGLCCANGSKCSYSADFKYSACCSPDDTVCFGGCCDAEDVCCKTTNGTPYCCEKGLTCTNSGSETCVKA
jgi:hypothetical protein